MKAIVLLLVAAAGSAQVAEKANANYRTKEGREGMARSLSAPERAERLKAAEMARSIGIKPGMLVADLGSGTGAFLPVLSATVGASGRVIAQDIFREFLDKARAKAEAEQLANVMYVEGTERNPNLPENCCDLVVTVDAYHHFDYPEAVLAGVRKALRPGGRLAVVEYYKRFDAMGNGAFALEHIRLDADDVVKEVEGQGFQLAERREHVPGKQYIAVFTVR